MTAVLLSLTVFIAWPDLDLAVSRAFWLPATGFAGDGQPGVRIIYRSVPWLGRAAALAGLLMVLWRHPRQPSATRWRRRAMALALTVLLGAGGLVDGLLKDHWGRARPLSVQAFGGTLAYTPAWQPSDQCRKNCSFVSGHAATGFSVLAVGLFGTVRTRLRWWLAGMVAGAVIGLARLMQGAHFLSDIVFAALAIWLCALAIRTAWLHARRWRWRRRRRQRADDDRARASAAAASRVDGTAAGG